MRDQAPVDCDRKLTQARNLLQRKDRDIVWRDAKIEKITFELARLKRWKFGASSESMDAEQRRLCEETLVEDEESLRAQLEQLRLKASADNDGNAKPKTAPRQPRRQALPDHLRRVEHRHEPDSTDCQEPGCGRPMTRIGEDMSERLDIVPAEFFVHRHIYGKWTCRCCQILNPINAHTPRSTRWRLGPARRARRWSRSTRCTRPSSSLAGSCMPKRRRWRCSIPVRARRAGPTSGPTRGAGTTPCPAWSMSSAWAAARSTQILPGW